MNSYPYANDSNPNNILALLHKEFDPDAVISLSLYGEAKSHSAEDDIWRNLIPVLSHDSVYEAFGISTVPTTYPVSVSIGLEVIGTLANLLQKGRIYSPLVSNHEEALREARQFLDGFCTPSYNDAIAYRIDGAWCNWFIDEGILDVTLLFNNKNSWWLLAVTGSD